MKKQTQKKRPAKGAKNTDRAAVILSLFREFPNNKFSLKHLASASGGATKEGRRETFEILGRLHDEGIVEECAREKYRLTHKHLPHFEGVADMTATGSIYVRVEGEEKDIFVNQRNTANALNGDRVEVVVMHRGRDGKMEGEITRIVERSRKPYVGIAEVGAHQIFVRADSRRMPMDIYLSKRLYPDVKDGEKVVVRIADWAEGSKSPVGELIERLGMAGNNDTEMHAILAEYELPYRFEPEVEQAAEDIDGRITAKEIAQRRDFRNVTTFTVDPADAKDFDDALSVRKVGEGIWEIGVHIADVTHYVRPHSVIDDEAVERGTSVYLVDRTVPMLPERLSNELCSLRPHEASLCFSAVFTINEGLELLDEWFGRTVIHSDRRFTYAEAQEIIEKCLPHAGKSVRIGITGVPGAGKSTFIEAVGNMVTSLKHKLAVLAIDPSSERSGGSILGDKTRMESISSNPKVFIRPSPSAGSLGGVARKTRETIILCEAAGFDVIFIETVGVGQSETAVHSMVDMFMMLQISGAGDELQGIKRGIMEMADMMVITKADGENIHKAELAKTQYQGALRLFPVPESGWRPKVYTCSAYTKTGLEEVWKGVEEFLDFIQANGYFTHNRNRQNKYWMYETIDEVLKNSFYHNPQIEPRITELEQKVLDAKVSSFVAAHELLELYFKNKN